MFLAIVLVLLAVWSAVFRWRRRRMHELADKIGGPKQLPILGHAHMFSGNNIMTTMKNFSYYSLDNGGVSTIWVAHVLFILLTDPVDAEYVLKKCLEKDDVHKYFRDVIGNGAIFAPVKIWKVRRKVMLPAFSPKIVENFVNVFSEQSKILRKQINRKVGTGTFDVWPFLSAYTLDSVSETIMGTKLASQTKINAPLLQSLNIMMNLICERIFHLWLQSDMIFNIYSIFTKYYYYRKVVWNFIDDVIDTKREENIRSETLEKRTNKDVDQDYGLEAYKMKTFLDLLIESSGKTTSYSDLELREELLTLAAAGTDTSAVTMCFTMVLLGKHPDVQERVYQELLYIYGNSDRPLVKEDLTKMVYLERVIKESLRLYPPAPFIIRKVEKEITLQPKVPASGKILPAGSGVPVSIFGLHRNKKYWGEDAEVFDPDRFSPERFNLAHPCAYIPFSAGPRNCLGHQFAMQSIKTVISTILRKYRVSVPEESIKSNIRVKLDVMMKAANGYEIQLEERNP